MANKKKNTQFKEKTDITGIVCIVLGLLILISLMSVFFENSSPGLFGMIVRKLLFSLFGLGAYILPFILFFMGICYISKNGEVQYNKNFYICITLIINTLVLLTMSTYKGFYSDSIFNVAKNFYNCNHIFHGGLICYLMVVPVKLFLGTIGVYIINIAVYLVCFIMMYNISLSQLFYKIKGKTAQKDNKKNNKKEGYDKIDVVSQNDVEHSVTSNLDTEKELKNKSDVINLLKNYEPEKEVYNAIEKEENVLYNNNCTETENNSHIKKEEKASVNCEKEVPIAIKDNSSTDYKFPPVNLLKENNFLKNKRTDRKELMDSGLKLKETLKSFGVNVTVNHIIQGPAVTRYEIQPESGVKVSKIVNLSDDIALNLAASGIRMEAPIPGKAAIGIEVPNQNVMPVFIRELIDKDAFKNYKGNIAVCLGKDIAGNEVVTDLSRMPHLLVAGATGSGKSVCINTLIASLLYKYTPKEVNLLLIDPKVVELSIYNGIPHLLIPVVTDPKKAAGALNWAVNEMTRRYNLFAENGVRNIEGYNQLKSDSPDETLSYTVIIIDELADLMMVCPKEVEDYIARLAQMARAAGMHLVIATQRPSVDVITGTIKANIPSRISFAVSSQIDSRTILDSSGAEKLLGKGDMLFYPVGEPKPIRIQGAFISEEEVENIVNFIRKQSDEVTYDENIIEQIHSSSPDNNGEGDDKSNSEEEPLLDEAMEYVVKSGYASASMLQRKFKIGYNRAARLIDIMEDRGVISGRNGSKPREIL
ncbi:DNA translocase FtsK [Hathewaya proteolytica DSM 3090]|uniref:DNA translocase FtsK n=1 Tax=Hathewaya proteolytica DSM 3090 TaxID=1121331 RepID=A0A1M6J4P0_9CLOT|nr:DNA translocase FtsK [Hathewaya proteolytica]SHJ41646.1 DNA translocase FtsK [Hathewaya proteolytica DSM 3090]